MTFTLFLACSTSNSGMASSPRFNSCSLNKATPMCSSISRRRLEPTLFQNILLGFGQKLFSSTADASVTISSNRYTHFYITLCQQLNWQIIGRFNRWQFVSCHLCAYAKNVICQAGSLTPDAFTDTDGLGNPVFFVILFFSPKISSNVPK